MIPHHLNGGDEQTLVGGVDATKRGAERHHVEVGITLREQTTLKTSVDALDDGLLAKQLLV